MKNILSILIMLVISVNMYGQSDLSVYYNKALEHIEKGNNASAIRTLSRVIRQDNKYEQALLMRAEAKYNMKAYRSARVDVLEHINHRGIGEKAITLLANIDYKLDNNAALDTHITLNKMLVCGSTDENKKSIVNERLGNMFFKANQTAKACEHWTTAVVFGSSSAEKKVSQHCQDFPQKKSKQKAQSKRTMPSKKTSKTEKPTQKEKKTKPTYSKRKKTKRYLEEEESAYDQMNKGRNVEKLKRERAEIEKQRRIEEARQRDQNRYDSREELEEKNDDLYNVDKDEDDFVTYVPPTQTSTPKRETKNTTQSRNTTKNRTSSESKKTTRPTSNDNKIVDKGIVNTIKIDDELTLELLKGGIGERAIVKTPNILILSEKDGKVAVDICIDNKGYVTAATYNNSYSTLDTKHLIALAVRKAKQFRFKSSTTDEQCGILVFNIKQS